MAAEEEPLGEPRWPIALAVLVFIALMVALRHFDPRRQSFLPSWFVPLVLVLLFVTLVTADPHGDTRRATWLRRCSIVLIVVLAGAAVSGRAVTVVTSVTWPNGAVLASQSRSQCTVVALVAVQPLPRSVELAVT